MRGAEKLSATRVKKLKEPGRYGDGRGLWLQVSPTGSKAWLFRYMLHGRAREMGLGPLDVIGLAAAREKARDARRLLLEGRDPIDVKRESFSVIKLAAAKSLSFADCARQYIDTHKRGWKNDKHAAQWTATLLGNKKTKAVTAAINGLPVAEIDTALIIKVLEPVWTEKPETAGRVRGRIERVLAWATVSGFRQGDNPARWRGHLKEMLPAKSKIHTVKHHAAMPYSSLPEFMGELRGREGVSARALEFTILNASRTGEVIGARWSEIDLAGKVWTIPADRMKAAREHRVPLCDRSIKILQSLPREAGSEFVFIGSRTKRPLSNMAMAELLKGANSNGFTVHGFRSTFRDWARERTNYPRDIVETSLAHTVKDRTEAAYLRGDALEKRRQLMGAWERYCARPAEAAGGTVTAIREVAR